MSNSSYINALVRSLYEESQDHNVVTLSGSQPEIRSPNAIDSQSEPPSLFTRSSNTWGGQFNPDHFQRNAFAMMSASPVNMENAAFAAMTAASHHKYEKNEKRSDRINEKSYWVNGSHVDETITYNQYTIDTAVLAPTTESPEIKQAILQQSVNSIKQTKTTMEHKVDFLMKRYTSVCPDVRSRVNAATSELFDVTSDVYEFASLHVIDNTGQAIATGPGPGLPAPFRAAATYFRIELRLVPRLCSLRTDIGINPTKFPPSSNRAVYVPVPRVQNQMDVSITRQMIMDQAHHKEIIAAMAALGEEFSMRAATRDGEPDNEAYEKWSKQQIAKTQFQALEQALMATYVGLQQGMETPNQQLAKLNMIRYEGGTMMYDSVATLFGRIATILNGFNHENPPPTNLSDLAGVAFQAFTQEIKDVVAEHLETGAAGPLLMDYPSNLSRMHRLRERAEKEEKRIKQLVGIANSAGLVRPNRSCVPGPSAPTRPGGRAFAGFHQQGFQEFQDNCSFQTPKIATDGTFHTALTTPPAPERNVRVTDGQGRQLLVPTSDSKLYCPQAALTMLACMSAAEEAFNIEEESDKTSSIHCWGCQKIGHTFRECPHKGDPGVISQ
ncbi:unnamed protein product, partial [Cylindrotheca closterium]